MVNRSKTKRDRGELGTIRVPLAGAMYADVDLETSDRLRLRREPKNPHDANAIAVETAPDRRAGYIPRDVAAWLAPLMDGDRVRVSARVLNRSGRDGLDYEGELLLGIQTGREGRGILRERRQPANASEALHEMVRRTYRSAGRYKDPTVVRRLHENLSVLPDEDMLPETHLLIALLPSIADRIGRGQGDRAAKAARAALRALRVGPPLQHGGLAVFPLVGDNGHEPAYTLLEEAVADETAEVTEVGKEGSVPELVVRNRGPRPVLIPEGDILVGAKQDRVVNITIIVAARSEQRIPVSCVEQGRWRRTSRHFSVDASAPPTLRGRKTRSVHRNLRASGAAFSDQGEVWATVDERLHAAGVRSASSAMHDLHRAREKEIAAFRDALELPGDALGVVVAQGGEVLGMDLFDSHVSLRRAWGRLSGGYVLEALTAAAGSAKADPHKVQNFLDQAAQCLAPEEIRIGAGTALSLEGESITGTGVWYEGRLCHVSAFPTDETR